MNESQNIEWKESWRDDYLKWICGFANAAGGKIYIGMNDSGQVVGVADAKKLLEDIPNKVRDVLGIIVDVNLLEKDGLEYIEIDVPPYSNPINYKGQYHYRSGSTKQELKGAALNRFILQRTGRHWDEFPIERAKVEELSASALNRFRKEAARSGRVDEGVLNDNTEHLLHDLRLIDEDGHLNRAALLLFHPDPERFVPKPTCTTAYEITMKSTIVSALITLDIEKQMDERFWNHLRVQRNILDFLYALWLDDDRTLVDEFSTIMKDLVEYDFEITDKNMKQELNIA